MKLARSEKIKERESSLNRLGSGVSDGNAITSMSARREAREEASLTEEGYVFLLRMKCGVANIASEVMRSGTREYNIAAPSSRKIYIA